HTSCSRDWSSDVCSSDLPPGDVDREGVLGVPALGVRGDLALGEVPHHAPERLLLLGELHVHPGDARGRPAPVAPPPARPILRADGARPLPPTRRRDGALVSPDAGAPLAVVGGRLLTGPVDVPPAL